MNEQAKVMNVLAHLTNVHGKLTGGGIFGDFKERFKVPRETFILSSFLTSETILPFFNLNGLIILLSSYCRLNLSQAHPSRFDGSPNETENTGP